MTVQLSAGKWQRLRSLTDEEGRFKMMAIDQRDSMRRSISQATGTESEAVTDNDLITAKEVITKVLAPFATAVLTDPVYGYPSSIQHLPPRVGLLLSYEESGYEKVEPNGKGRVSSLIEGWSASDAQRLGADAVKLLINYRPDLAAEDVIRHQQDLVRRVGDECEALDMPFLLEIVTYAVEEEDTDSFDFARKKPELVISSAAEFSLSKYKVDVLKLEFPANLKWTKEFSIGTFDREERKAIYSLNQTRDYCKQLNDVTGAPWVILSSGVDIEEFLIQLDLATEAGASGFLCGRAIWKDAIKYYPDIAKMEEWLGTMGVYNFVRANAYAHRALPWFDHRKFNKNDVLAS